MKIQKYQLIIPSLIFLALLVALLPAVLSNNYLRQDDFMLELWPGMKMSDFGFNYYNTVYQLVRPVCEWISYITYMISLNMHHSVYVRFLNIATVSFISMLIYRWQLLFNENKLLAITYSIAAFTLPPFQIFVGTANYFCILAALLFAVIAMFVWYCAVFQQNKLLKTLCYLVGCVLFFASLLDYPLASMFAWPMLTICYLNNDRMLSNNRSKKLFNVVSFLLITLMIGFYFFIKLFHLVLKVNLSFGRTAVVDMHDLFARFIWTLKLFAKHTHLWLYAVPTTWESLLPISCLSLLFILILLFKKKYSITNLKKVLVTITITFLLLVLSYSPAMATSEITYSFRYAVATMPLLLYILFWIMYQISQFAGQFFKLLSSCSLITITLFGIVYSNWMLTDGIVGPQVHDFSYAQNQLQEKVLPFLKQNQEIVLHVIDCDGTNHYQYPVNVPTAIEYGMRICQYRGHAIGLISHSLMSLGYISNFHRRNTITYNKDEIVISDMPWGVFVINNKETSVTELTKYTENKRPIITIDLRNNPPYQPLQFYRELIGKT